MKKASVVRVAVDGAVFHYDKPFDYLLPPEWEEKGLPGCRVLVPFGRGNRKRQGVILSRDVASGFDALKPVAAVLDDSPVLSDEMLALVERVREQTFCTYYDAVKLMLPVGIHMKLVASFRAAPGLSADALPDGLGEKEARLLCAALTAGSAVERGRLLELTDLPADSPLPDALVAKGLLVREDDAVRRVGDATVRMARLSDDFDPARARTPKQQAVVDLLADVGAASLKEIGYFTGVTAAVINALEKKGEIAFFEEEIYRSDVCGEPADTAPITLTEEQETAFEGLLSLSREGKGSTALLYGVTGSGKTQVFLRLVDETVAQGKGVIVMVPEIALTPQTLSLFRRRYGERVAVFHSAMSLGRRLDEWKRVRDGQALVAVGTRSAVFAPFNDLGLILMDEEQEHTYKSESSPRYHARDVARFRAAWHKCLLVLASATPSVETFSQAKSGRYALFTLRHRYGGARLPEVQTVDMRQELREGNASPFSRALLMRVGETLDAGRQVILLLNRRGHHTVVACASCGAVMTCPNCSLSLTYHSDNNRLMCHTCGYSTPFVAACPACGATRIKYAGVGTQRAERELREQFPEARILRMDADSTMARRAYEDKLSAFARGEYDVLLGTQMIAKGLDFPNVTLVGVLGADGALYSEDYRSFERTFSLLTQVVGRSGRGDDAGLAVVQSIAPDNEIIELAARQDYDAFYEQEILTRKAMIYPPYCSLILIGFTGDAAGQVAQAADRFLELLRRENEAHPEVPMIVLGPSPAVLARVSGHYRYRLFIKTKFNREFRLMLADVLRAFGKDPANKAVTVFADRDPESLF